MTSQAFQNFLTLSPSVLTLFVDDPIVEIHYTYLRNTIKECRIYVVRLVFLPMSGMFLNANVYL